MNAKLLILTGLCVGAVLWSVGNGALAHQNGVGAEEPEWWGKVALPALAGVGGLLWQYKSKLPGVVAEARQDLPALQGLLGQGDSDPVKDLLADAGKLMIEQDDLAGLDALSSLLKARKKPAEPKT